MLGEVEKEREKWTLVALAVVAWRLCPNVVVPPRVHSISPLACGKEAVRVVKEASTNRGAAKAAVASIMQRSLRESDIGINGLEAACLARTN